MEQVLQAAKDMAKEIGYYTWRQGVWVAYGGVSSVTFKDTPDLKIWKKVNLENYPQEYFPRMSNKQGKELAAKLRGLPTVSIKELNDCLGFKETLFKSIGFYRNNDTYFGFTTNDGWKFKAPADCKEITYTEFKKLFKLRDNENR